MILSRTVSKLSCSHSTTRNTRSSWVWTRLARPVVLSFLSTVLIPPAQSQALQPGYGKNLAGAPPWSLPFFGETKPAPEQSRRNAEF
jgi:hypothetical protein